MAMHFVVVFSNLVAELTTKFCFRFHFAISAVGQFLDFVLSHFVFNVGLWPNVMHTGRNK